MGRSCIPAAFDPSHASLIDVAGINPIYNHLSDTWSCLPVNACTPYGDLVEDARKTQHTRRPPAPNALRAMGYEYDRNEGSWVEKRSATGSDGRDPKRVLLTTH